MHFRLPLWLAIFALIALGTASAQTPAPSTLKEGQIIVAKVHGKVSMLLNGVTSDLHDKDRVNQSATITTGADSSVILVFSNGASTQLSSDTTLVIEKFLQDPFSADIKVAELETEPTTSQTQLRLAKGELVGKVVHLNEKGGSTFTVKTPVGAAGIRGTTFRIVFRPTGNGQAFAFSLSTAEGRVLFEGEMGPGGTTPGTPNGGQPGNGQGNGGVSVPTGQEIVVVVNADVNPTTGVVTITAPPVITSTTKVSPETQATITLAAQTIVTAVATTTFTPTPPSGGNSNSGQSQDQQKDQKKDDKKDETPPPPPSPSSTNPVSNLTGGAGQ
jgi:hypothetical protein